MNIYEQLMSVILTSLVKNKTIKELKKLFYASRYVFKWGLEIISGTISAFKV